MHMADALLSPAVGGAMMVATIGVASYSVKKVQKDPLQEESKVPLMGVMGAFVFAAQMINFAIPGTGSSGHLGGGLMLAILLGPHAGFLTMACVLFIQALFFGDGGLLAFGANVFNLGFYSCFVAYPLIYKPIAGYKTSTRRIVVGSILAAVVGLQLGSFSVVLETMLSGKTELPFLAFAGFMQPIHLAIGVVEGVVTAAVIGYVWNTRPEILSGQTENTTRPSFTMKRLVIVLVFCAVVMGAFLSLLASGNPDGLEWSIQNVTGSEVENTGGFLHDTLGAIQEKISFLTDYQFENDNQNTTLGTSVSGLLGGFLTLAMAGGLAVLIHRISKKKRAARTTEL